MVIEEGITEIGFRSFYDCAALTNITIPNSVTSIGECAFERCTGLTSISIGGATSIGGYAFNDCTSLTSISISDSVTDIEGTAFLNTGYYNNEENWIDDILYIDSFVIDADSSVSGELRLAEGITHIAGSAFSFCNNLTSITLPDSVTSIGAYAFFRCDSLRNISIPDSVTSIETYAFYECTNLESITIPDSVTSIGSYAIVRCTSLKNIEIPDEVTSIGDFAFYDCTGLTNITIPNGVIYIGSNAFVGCTNLNGICFISDKTAIAANALPKNDKLQIFALKDSKLYNTLTAQDYNVIPYGFTVNEDDKNKPMLALYSKVDFTRDMWSCIWQLIEDTDVEYVYFDELNIIEAMPEDVIECNTPDKLEYKQVKFSVVKDNKTIRLWEIDEKTSYDGFVDALLNTVVRFDITLQQIISGAFRYIIRFFKK